MIYNPTTYDFTKLDKIPAEKRRKGNQGTKQRRVYKSCLCAFDIETTRIEEIEQAIMYVWQFQINEDTIIGRTWPEFLDFIQHFLLR